MMRTFSAAFLTAGLALLAASPTLAQQPPPGGFFRMMQQPNAAMLLRDPKVQEELKITDDQKEKLQKIGEKYKDDLQKAFSDRDFKKVGELMKQIGDDVEKAAPDILKADQVKRLKQLEVQRAGLGAFTKEDVATALKLTDKQKKDIEEAKTDMEKDGADLLKDAAGDREKMGEAIKKVAAMQKEAVDKVVNSLSDDQKKEWKELTGEKFEFSPFGARPPRPNGNDR